jgi:hypothetical protein
MAGRDGGAGSSFALCDRTVLAGATFVKSLGVAEFSTDSVTAVESAEMLFSGSAAGARGSVIGMADSEVGAGVVASAGVSGFTWPGLGVSWAASGAVERATIAAIADMPMRFFSRE